MILQLIIAVCALQAMEERERMDDMIKLLKYLKPYRGFAAASVFLVLITNILQLINPLLTEQMINEGIQMADPEKILRIGGTMLAISAANILISVLNTYCNAKTSSGYSTLLRKAIFRKVQTLSQSDINKIGVASLITRSSNDITQVQQMIMTVLQQIIAVPVLLVGGLVMAISKSAELSKIILIIVPVILVLFLVLLAFLMPLFNKMQERIDNLNQVIREKLSGIRVIRAFNRNTYEDERFRVANLDLTSIALKVQRIFAFMLPIAVLLVFGLVAVLFWYTGNHANSLDPTIAAQREELANTIGTLTAFVTYLMLVISAVTLGASLFAVIPKASISAKRILAVLDMQTEVNDPENPQPMDKEKEGWVEFRSVSFTYHDAPEEEPKKKSRFAFLNGDKKKKPEKENQPAASAMPLGKKQQNDPMDDLSQPTPIPAADEKSELEKEAQQMVSLEDISFTSKPGEVTAILGGTGSGKSTLVSLIPRLYDVDAGEVLVNGVNVKNQTLSDLHSAIAYIPQKAFLFSGTIADNIRYGKPDATEEEINRALEIAQAKGFVDKMPDGIHSMISQAGTNVSGGQRQRLAIARAVVKNAKICIFDDSFSALDLATDAKLRAAIRENLTDTNIIIVAQRIGTVLDADRILVLDHGKAVGMGTHKELMETCQTYRDMVYSQLSKEEVDAL